MFARVISAEAAPEGIDSAIRLARDQLPDAQAQPGFSGLYLLVDRAAGKVWTISLRESSQNLRAVEPRAAQARGDAAAETGVLAPGVEVHQVAVQV